MKIPIARCRAMAVGCSAFHSHYSGVINLTLFVGRRGTGKSGLTIRGKKKKETLDLDFTGFVYVTGGKLKHALRLAGTVTRRADGRNGSL